MPINTTDNSINKPQEKKQDSSEKITEVQNKAKWLSEKIQDGLIRSKRKKRRFKIKASVIKISIVLISGIVTVLLGLQINEYKEQFKMLAFILGAIVTVLNALEPFFSFHSLWIEHEETVYQLYRLQEDFTFYLIGKRPEDISLNVLEEFNIRYGKIWVNVSQKWLELRRIGEKIETN